MRVIQSSIHQKRDEELERLFQAAAHLDSQGQWAESLEIYKRLREYLPEADPRRKYAERCIAAINHKQSFVK